MKPTIILELGTTCHVNCSFCYKEYDKIKDNYFKSITSLKEEIKQIATKGNYVLLV
jgi:MoaA/NifB/PqqE/SkfB family radical SAM enzyme